MRRLRLAAAGLLAAGLVAGVALAADPAAKKAPTIADLKGRSVDVRPDSAVDPGAARARENYEQFLNLDGGDSALRSEAMRRLGDLKLEAGELNRIEQEIAQGSPLDTRDAIALYTRLLAIYPNYERNDAVLYQLARAYEADQQADKALAALEQMVNRYPASRYVDEAYFRRGEILFVQRNWPEAEAAYAAVIAFGNRSEFYEQGLYKHGWSRFKRGENEGGLDSFAKLLDRKLLDARGGEKDLETFTRPQRELVEDTLRVSAISFSFEDDAKGVDHFLERHGPRAYSHLLYETLGDLYTSKERWTDAANAYRAFAMREPDHEKSPLLQTLAIGAYKRGGFASLVLEGKREYVERYGLTASFWAHRRPADSPLVVQDLKTNLQDLAAYYHEQAQATKQISDYHAAAHFYREFLSSFPEDKDSASTNYRLADSLFESHQYAEAAVEYEHSAYNYPQNDQSATAGYAALVAYENHEPELSGDARKEWHRASLESALRFATTFQDHPESTTVLVRTAREMYDAQGYAKAVDVADIVLARRPEVERRKQVTAWTVIANAKFELGEYPRAEEAYLQVQKLLPDGDPEHVVIEERLAAAIYKQGESHRADGADAAAVEDFLRVARVAPKAKIRATADYDAAALLIGLKDWPRAIAVLESFRSNFPSSELQREVTRKLAVAYTEAGRSDVAAVEFERISNTPGTAPEMQREALAQAAVLYEKAGDSGHTTSALEAYVKRFPAPFDAAVEARQKLADLAMKRDPARRKALLEELVRVDQTAGADRTDRSRYLAARAALELALPARDAFNAIRLVLPLKKSLEAKRTAMQRAIKDFEGADAYAIAEVSTSATFEIAELYRRLAEDLIKSDRPKTLKGEELEQYDLLLEEQAYPFEERAIEIHLVNTARAQHGLYDDSVRASYAKLAKLKPARFGKFEQDEEYTIDVRGGAAAAGAQPPSLAESVRFQEAVAIAQAGNTTGAEAEFAAIAGTQPELAGPPFNLGIAQEKEGRYADAEKALSDAVRRNPSAAANDMLAIVQRNLGKFAEAAASYARAIELEPDSARVHRNAGVLEDLYLDHPAEALGHFEKALAAGGDEKLLGAWIAELHQRISAAQKAAPAAEPQ